MARWFVIRDEGQGHLSRLYPAFVWRATREVEGTFCSSLGNHLWHYALIVVQARNDDDDDSRLV